MLLSTFLTLYGEKPIANKHYNDANAYSTAPKPKIQSMEEETDDESSEEEPTEQEEEREEELELFTHGRLQNEEVDIQQRSTKDKGKEKVDFDEVEGHNEDSENEDDFEVLSEEESEEESQRDREKRKEKEKEKEKEQTATTNPKFNWKRANFSMLDTLPKIIKFYGAAKLFSGLNGEAVNREMKQILRIGSNNKIPEIDILIRVNTATLDDFISHFCFSPSGSVIHSVGKRRSKKSQRTTNAPHSP